ncbi:uncharacterized protein ASCRUDRAFT_69815 [Ascoidea rubescens DSM 1968]|uniref:Uncharacterized protein n=1 Tax=Ascoidea rubescens DSM 1968 TaxID=1344418 RepID=A0A1D2VKJ6_9ASCO|nr:hypothetical protein ASCRUDRAFT_69815 [Ascoidea rubescens DSM 1968]ODV62134.1 hypothetical protein ASCRUDRAFT_69815 [Ascoidea rubescens DSM 1968]
MNSTAQNHVHRRRSSSTLSSVTFAHARSTSLSSPTDHYPSRTSFYSIDDSSRRSFDGYNDARYKADNSNLMAGRAKTINTLNLLASETRLLSTNILNDHDLLTNTVNPSVNALNSTLPPSLYNFRNNSSASITTTTSNLNPHYQFNVPSSSSISNIGFNPLTPTISNSVSKDILLNTHPAANHNMDDNKTAFTAGEDIRNNTTSKSVKNRKALQKAKLFAQKATALTNRKNSLPFTLKNDNETNNDLTSKNCKFHENTSQNINNNGNTSSEKLKKRLTIDTSQSSTLSIASPLNSNFVKSSTKFNSNNDTFNSKIQNPDYNKHLFNQKSFNHSNNHSYSYNHNHHHHINLRSRKDLLHSNNTFSSSTSNSKLLTSNGITLYNFNPTISSSSTFTNNRNNNTFSNDFLKQLAYIQSSIDIDPQNSTSRLSSKEKDSMTTDLMFLLYDSVIPLFKGESLKVTIEDLNKLVDLYLSLRIGNEVFTSNDDDNTNEFTFNKIPNKQHIAFATNTNTNSKTVNLQNFKPESAHYNYTHKSRSSVSSNHTSYGLKFNSHTTNETNQNILGNSKKEKQKKNLSKSDSIMIMNDFQDFIKVGLSVMENQSNIDNKTKKKSKLNKFYAEDSYENDSLFSLPKQNKRYQSSRANLDVQQHHSNSNSPQLNLPDNDKNNNTYSHKNNFNNVKNNNIFNNIYKGDYHHDKKTHSENYTTYHTRSNGIIMSGEKNDEVKDILYSGNIDSIDHTSFDNYRNNSINNIVGKPYNMDNNNNFNQKQDINEGFFVDETLNKRIIHPNSNIINGENDFENIENKLATLWEFFYNDVLSYLEAIFLPIQLEFEGSGKILNTPQLSKKFWYELLIPEENLSIKRFLLIYFRDFIVIPNYETMINFDSCFKSSDLICNNYQTNLINGQNMISKDTASSKMMHDQFTKRLCLLQCFGVLSAIQTGNTLQRLVKNLLEIIKNRIKYV